MAIFNNESAIRYTKELTTTAIEHNVIPTDKDSTKTAENVYEFYKTLYEKFSGDTVK